MPKRIIMLIVIVLLLSGCSKQTAAPEPGVITPSSAAPEQSPDKAAQTPEPAYPSDTEIPDTEKEEVSAPVRVSAALEDGYTLAASLDNDLVADPVYVYLYAEQRISDILISSQYASDDNEPEEMEGTMYIPELSPGQAVKLLDMYPYSSDTDSYHTKIAYINESGGYETMLLQSEENENPVLLSTEPVISETVYDKNYMGEDQFITSDLLSAQFREKTLDGEFDSYVPKGLCIAGGTLGDVNGDGTQDALMYLLSGGPRADFYTGVMPLFILIGKNDGGYAVEKKVPDALFAPYRSASYAIAGNGYIDIVCDYVGGAACHHTQVCRFVYLPDKKDWVLSGFSYQPTYAQDYTENLEPEFVSPLPAMTDLPLEKLSGNEFYNSPPDWSYFDETCQLESQDMGTYTLGVLLNNTEGYYEGYIYMYFESIQSGGFIQTIRGRYNPGSEPQIYADNESGAFVINQDVWKADEYDSDSFYMS